MANKQFLDKDGADYLVQGLKAKIPTKVSELTNDSGFKTTDNDTKNTAGSTDTSSKIFLVGATSQAANPQTYSHDTAYVGTDGCLYSNGKKVLTDHQSLSSLVPNTRTVNGKALSSDISLTASDVGALPSDTVIPTVNNATLTIQKNGTTVKTFTANASDNVTANITVPTKVSELTNDSGYKTTDNNTTYSLTQDATNGHKITLTPSTGTAQTITIPDNNTTYTFATGDSNGQIKVTPSGGSAQNINVKGLGSAAYTASTDYLAANGNAASSTLLNWSGKPTTGSTEISTWRNGVTDGEVVWGQRWKDTAYSTDAGDLSLWLKKSSDGSTATINMTLDGTVTAVGGFIGNADSASKLRTARKINGVSFDGSADITIPDNDTKNTAGSTDTSSKIFLVGATSQAANPQTYSDNEVFATNGQLTSKSFSLGGNAFIEYNSTEKCIEFNFS